MFKRKARPNGVAPISQQRDVTPLSDSLPGPDQDDDDTTISETLDELIALRKLKRATGGIDLERLNAGEKKKRRKVTINEDGSKITEDGMIEGTQGGIKGKDRVRDEIDEGDDPGAATRRLVKSNNFTGQTNAVDVDKHMMAYIEEELRKRKGDAEDVDVDAELKSLDPRDALYQVADKYKLAKSRTEEEDENNVQLSAAMLTAIPEVDLGIDRKLKNIEDTEKAKRRLAEEKAAALARAEDEEFAADRFYRARRPLESDADALAKARREAVTGESTENHQRPRGIGRRELATDDQAMQRFKQRQQNQRR